MPHAIGAYAYTHSAHTHTHTHTNTHACTHMHKHIFLKDQILQISFAIVSW
jgi:hypothetical protein